MNLLFALLTAAHAGLGATPASGAVASGSIGFGASGAPVAPSLAWDLSVGGWWGRYDDSLALGRHWAVGIRTHQDVAWLGDEPRIRTAPMFELRRGIDLLVVGAQLSVLGGPVFASNAPDPTRLAGGTLRVAGGLKYRFHTTWGAVLRLEAGIDAGQRVSPAIGLTLGLEAFGGQRH